MFPYLGSFDGILPFHRIKRYYQSVPLDNWKEQCSPLDAHIYEHRPAEEVDQSKYYGTHNATVRGLPVIDQDFFSDFWFKSIKAKKEGYFAKIITSNPGHTEPPHKDFYPSFLNNVNPDDGSPITTSNIQEVGRKIIRCWIPLQDSKVGHLLFSDDFCLHSWKVGDVFQLPTGITHGFVNAGREDRYTLVFTGWRDDD